MRRPSAVASNSPSSATRGTLWPQPYVTHAPSGKPWLDDIGRGETLDIIAWLNHIWSRSENGESRNDRVYDRDSDTIDAVRKIYAQDIALFAYDV